MCLTIANLTKLVGVSWGVILTRSRAQQWPGRQSRRGAYEGGGVTNNSDTSSLQRLWCCGAGSVIDYLNLNYDTSPHSRHCRHSFLVLILDVTHAAQQHIIRLEKLNLCMFCQQQQSWSTPHCQVVVSLEQCAARSSVGQDEGCILQWLVLTKHRGGVTRRDGGEDSRQPPAAMATKSRIKNVAAGSQQPHKNYGYGTTAASITLPQ